MSRNSSAKKPRRTLWFWLALGTAALLMALLALSPSFQGLVDEAIDWATGLMNEHPVIGAGVFFLFSAVSAMLAFASSVVLVPPANLVWGKTISFLLLWGGWLLGAVTAFGIGRLARPLLVHSGYEDKLETYQQYVSQRMKFWAALLLCIAVPSEIPGYLFGSMHYPFLKFLAAMAIAESGYALAAVVAGESLLTGQPVPFLAIMGVVAVVAVLSGLLLRRIKKRKSGGAMHKSGV